MQRVLLGSLIAAVGFASGSAVAADDSGAWYISPMGQYHDLDRGRISKDNFGAQIGLGYNLLHGFAVEADVIDALASGRLAGAYLDVFEREPLDKASPLWDMPNVLISPHTASHSLGQNEAIFEIFLDNLARFRGGQKLRNDVDDLG